MINIVDDYNPTNGDKIREMTDSELAQIIMCPQGMDPDICIAEKKDCYECCLEYLQQKRTKFITYIEYTCLLVGRFVNY